jgi:hypothetical protein
VNNKGIYLKLRFTGAMISHNVGVAILPCTEKGKVVAISVRAISDAKEYFVRTAINQLII